MDDDEIDDVEAADSESAVEKGEGTVVRDRCKCKCPQHSGQCVRLNISHENHYCAICTVSWYLEVDDARLLRRV